MLEVRDLSVSYGRHRALESANLRVEPGEICVILGANGAGKSTLLKAIAGMVRAESGVVLMNGKPISGLKPHRIVEEGIALVPEGRGIFGDLTVAENLQLGAFAARARDIEAARLEEIYRLFPRLAERKRQVARTMSGGEQQMVAIGRALMSNPQILMLDEPSLGLSPLLSKELFRALKEIARTGVGILLVEQNARQSLKISDRGYLIENGHVAGENTAEALMNNPAVINAYLGGAASPAAHEPRPQGLISAAIHEGLGAAGRVVEELTRRAAEIQARFIRALRRECPVPSAFAGLYDPDRDEVGEAGPMPPALRVSEDARALSGRAAEFAERAAERLARHIGRCRGADHVSPPLRIAADARALSERASELAAEASARLARHVSATREAAKTRLSERVDPRTLANGEDQAQIQPSPLIGHNSRFAVEDEASAGEDEVARKNHPEAAAGTAAWPVSDGIAALVKTLSVRQMMRAEGGGTVGWPVSDGIAALVAEAAKKQAVSAPVRGRQLKAFTVKPEEAAGPAGDGTDGVTGGASDRWPVADGIAALVEQARKTQSGLQPPDPDEDRDRAEPKRP